MTNVWHDIKFGGEKAPKIVNGIIEIPRRSKVKYEIDKETGLIKMDRILYSAMFYPENYGFIPQTLCEDGDALDILVITEETFVPLCLLECQVIGGMKMIDQGESDDKIIAVAKDDINYKHIQDISELPKHKLNEIKNFFEEYKKLENKEVRVEGFFDQKEAQKIIQDSVEMYKKKFA